MGATATDPRNVPHHAQNGSPYYGPGPQGGDSRNVPPYPSPLGPSAGPNGAGGGGGGQRPPGPVTDERAKSDHQKQKLKAYIRQHALKYVKAPPNPEDETYGQWYAGLRKVETIIYQKYMNKQRKRAQEQAMMQRGGAPPGQQVMH